jgi:hypothetical protein
MCRDRRASDEGTGDDKIHHNGTLGNVSYGVHGGQEIALHTAFGH